MHFNINHTIKGNKRGVIEEKQIVNVKYQGKLKEDSWEIKLDEAVAELDNSFEKANVSMTK